jgi:alkaline phosphatase D
MKRVTTCLWLGLAVLACLAQQPFNGPMPGHSAHMEVTVWMQCHTGCKAYLEYWPENRPDDRARTTERSSEAHTAHVLKFTPAPLEPGTRYRYRVVLDGIPQEPADTLRFSTQPIWRYRTDAPDFSLALGSCTYINQEEHDRPGKPYGDGLGIFNAIADKAPAFMLWMGDNIYLREPDFSRTGMLHRYTHTRSASELQRLLRSTHHYAIWDDHDFGPNDADGSYAQAALAREAFDLFWANPGSGVRGVDGITTAFSHMDIDFFLLDGRTFRVPGSMRTTAPQLLGKAQMDWLLQALKYSSAPFKMVVVGNQVLNPTAVYENYSTMPDERAELLRRIEEEGIRGVVFLTGDRHFTELSKLDLKDGRKLWDLTVSPLTAGPFTREEQNPLRVEGTWLRQRNFATLSFTGPRNKRVMTIRVFDSAGQPLWERNIEQEEKN